MAQRNHSFVDFGLLRYFLVTAVIAEVYALNALFAAVLIYGALRVQPANERWLVPALFVVLGLSLGNHPSIFLLLPSTTT